MERIEIFNIVSIKIGDVRPRSAGSKRIDTDIGTFWIFNQKKGVPDGQLRKGSDADNTVPASNVEQNQINLELGRFSYKLLSNKKRDERRKAHRDNFYDSSQDD